MKTQQQILQDTGDVIYTMEHVNLALGTFTYNHNEGIQMMDEILDSQQDDGLISQIMVDDMISDTYINKQDIIDNETVKKRLNLPTLPILSTILWYMIAMGFHDKDKLSPMFNKIMIFYDWYVKNRDPQRSGMISLYHPWEALYPTSPDYDEAMNTIYLDKEDIVQNIPYSNNYTQVENVRYMLILDKMMKHDWDNKTIYNEGLFNVCDPMTQFIFIKACKDLYKVAIYLQREDTYGKIEKWIDQYTRGSDLLWNSMYNAYSVLDIKHNTLFNGISCGGMLYNYADIGNTIQRSSMKAHTKRILHHTMYGYPSKEGDTDEYILNHRWLGSTWCFINLLLALGFRDVEIYNKIKAQTLYLIKSNGFFEYINPYARKTYGSDKCRNTEAIYLIFKSELFD